MAYLRTEHPGFSAGPDLLSRIGAAFSRGFDSWVKAHSRIDQVEALQAKSDAELAAMGLLRKDIVAHVFRDRMGAW